MSCCHIVEFLVADAPCDRPTTIVQHEKKLWLPSALVPCLRAATMYVQAILIS